MILLTGIAVGLLIAALIDLALFVMLLDEIHSLRESLAAYANRGGVGMETLTANEVNRVMGSWPCSKS